MSLTKQTWMDSKISQITWNSTEVFTVDEQHSSLREWHFIVIPTVHKQLLSFWLEHSYIKREMI